MTIDVKGYSTMDGDCVSTKGKIIDLTACESCETTLSRTIGEIDSSAFHLLNKEYPEQYYPNGGSDKHEYPYVRYTLSGKCRTC